MPKTWNTPGDRDVTGGADPTEPFEGFGGPTNSSQSTGGGVEENPFASGDVARRERPAEFVHGQHAAYAVGKAQGSVMSPETRLDAALDPDGYLELVTTYESAGLPLPEVFAEAEAVPVAALAGVAADFAPTVDQAAAFAKRFGATDPHAVVEAARAARNRGAAPSPSRATRRARVTWAVEIEPEPVVWAWEGNPDAEPEGVTKASDSLHMTPSTPSTPSGRNTGRIAAGSLSIAAGREGTGKSSFGIWMAANITRGTLPGSFYGTPRRVFYVALEDSWKHTLVPRLMAAGADLSMVGRFEVVSNNDTTMTLSLPSDNEMLEEETADHDVALIVIDPLMSVMGEKINANHSREVRTALDPLAGIADRTGAVVLGIAHFNKSTGTDASSLITGSGAFKDVPRAVFGFARDADERVMSQVKNSLGRDDLPSLSYRIEEAVVPTKKGDATTGKLVWLGESAVSVRDMLREAAAPDRDPGTDKPPAQRFVLKYIFENRDENGEVPAAEVIEKGIAAGFTKNEIDNARRRCRDPKITTRRMGQPAQPGGAWMWAAEGDPLALRPESSPEGVEGVEGVMCKESDAFVTPSGGAGPAEAGAAD